jgi:hypothetical protein
LTPYPVNHGGGLGNPGGSLTLYLIKSFCIVFVQDRGRTREDCVNHSFDLSRRMAKRKHGYFDLVKKGRTTKESTIKKATQEDVAFFDDRLPTISHFTQIVKKD